MIAGHSPGVHGAILTDALASRFSVQIQVGTFDLAHALKLGSWAIRNARHLATRPAKGEVAPEEDRDVVTEVVTTVFGRPMAPLALGRQI